MNHHEDETPRPPCYGDPRFTVTDRRAISEAISLCATCDLRICRPILAELLADPTAASQIEGVWDGHYYSAHTTGRDAWKKSA